MNEPMSHRDAPAPELSALSAALDDLAWIERQAAPPGLADRIYFRTARTFQSGAPRPNAMTPTFLRIAAVIALTALGAIGLRQPSAPAPADAVRLAALDELLPVASAPAWSRVPSNTLAEVQSELDALESDLDTFWTSENSWFTDNGEESL